MHLCSYIHVCWRSAVISPPREARLGVAEADSQPPEKPRGVNGAPSSGRAGGVVNLRVDLLGAEDDVVLLRRVGGQVHELHLAPRPLRRPRPRQQHQVLARLPREEAVDDAVLLAQHAELRGGAARVHARQQHAHDAD